MKIFISSFNRLFNGSLFRISIIFKTIFVEIKIYKNGILQKIGKTYFNPYLNSFCVNYDNLSFIFYIYYNQVEIFKDFKEKYFIYAQPELKKIRKNCIEINNINLSKIQNYSFLLNNSILDSNIFFNKELIKKPFNKRKKIYIFHVNIMINYYNIWQKFF